MCLRSKNNAEYLITFFSHFAAICFAKKLREKGGVSVMKPVPRNISSSCGTCVVYVGEMPEVVTDAIEQVFCRADEGWVRVLDNR
ncbi:MAG: DUF3343 domain-containing protein [Eubacteriales bacterium]|nr:DUF3343 domain-containing protein [Eubacteriales bacterium]